MKYFLSCDWGTSSFRLWLADAETGAVVAGVQSDEGIAGTYERFKESEEADRKAFYLTVISRHIHSLQAQVDLDLNGLPLVISGMASSSIGIIELPYAEVPFDIDGGDLNAKVLPANGAFAHNTLIISGAKTKDDVMRGEETQLIGCIQPGRAIENELFIIPGTHSKHISIKNNQVNGIRTYMTGEFFSLLAKKSILHASVEPGVFDAAAFKKGVGDSRSEILLHAVFSVRTNALFNVYSKTSNYSYLSGLLIGAELSDLHLSDAKAFTFLCSGDLATYYRTAFTTLFPDRQLTVLSGQQAEKAVIKGQLKIAKHLNLLP